MCWERSWAQLMVNWNMAYTPIESQTKGGYEEWAPELGHATMVFNRCWGEGLGGIIITRNQPVKGGMIGVSDGSQIGHKGSYGWTLIDYTNDYDSSG